MLYKRLTTLVERSEKPMRVHVVLMRCVPFRFTPGVAAQLEKKRTGPSQADVEAIKVHFVLCLCLRSDLVISISHHSKWEMRCLEFHKKTKQNLTILDPKRVSST